MQRQWIDMSVPLHNALFGWSEELRIWRIRRVDAHAMVKWFTEELEDMDREDLNNG